MNERLPWVLAVIGVLLISGLAFNTRAEKDSVEAEVVSLMTEAKVLYEEQGHATDALVLIDKAIALKPDTQSLRHRKAEVLIGARRDEEALDVLLEARELDPENWQSYTLLMKVWGRLDMCDTAIAEVEHYMASHPNWAKAYYARGFCHYKEHRWDLALADVQKACELGHKPGCEMADKYGKPAKILSVEREMIPQ
ncbi:MAG: tetratricopeptide repeat protein [Deltaproteobacteria bacterium]|nr:MAG: tetratricopeptide repeat protein [Deltaproteobacteria bacterium]